MVLGKALLYLLKGDYMHCFVHRSDTRPALPND